MSSLNAIQQILGHRCIELTPQFLIGQVLAQQPHEFRHRRFNGHIVGLEHVIGGHGLAAHLVDPQIAALQHGLGRHHHMTAPLLEGLEPVQEVPLMGKRQAARAVAFDDQRPVMRPDIVEDGRVHAGNQLEQKHLRQQLVVKTSNGKYEYEVSLENAIDIGYGASENITKSPAVYRINPNGHENEELALEITLADGVGPSCYVMTTSTPEGRYADTGYWKEHSLMLLQYVDDTDARKLVFYVGKLDRPIVFDFRFESFLFHRYELSNIKKYRFKNLF